jgi:hypothetical protein
MQTDSGDREPQVAGNKDLIYEQQSNEFRSLNTFFWQIPLIMMTLNGGLWFSVATLEVDPIVQRCMLWFAAGANLVMAVALVRLRKVMGDLLKEIRAYEGRAAPKTERIILWLFCGVFVVAATGALVASCEPSDRFLKATNAAKALKAAAPAPISNKPACPPPAAKTPPPAAPPSSAPTGQPAPAST